MRRSSHITLVFGAFQKMNQVVLTLSSLFFLGAPTLPTFVWDEWVLGFVKLPLNLHYYIRILMGLKTLIFSCFGLVGMKFIISNISVGVGIFVSEFLQMALDRFFVVVSWKSTCLNILDSSSAMTPISFCSSKILNPRWNLIYMNNILEFMFRLPILGKCWWLKPFDVGRPFYLVIRVSYYHMWATKL